MYNVSLSYLVPVLLEAGLALGGEVAGVVHHLQLPEDAPAGEDVHGVPVQALDLLNQDRRSENYNWARVETWPCDIAHWTASGHGRVQIFTAAKCVMSNLKC